MWENSVTEDVDFNKICRTCMKECEGLMFVFDSIGKYNNCTLNEMIMSCIQLEIEKEDGLPTKICSQCSHHVEEAYLFRLQAEKCNMLLKDIVRKRITSNDIYAEVPVKQEIIKDEIGHELEDEHFAMQQMDDSDDDRLPISSMKKLLVNVYICKFCMHASASEEDIISHLVDCHRDKCRVVRGKRGRLSSQELVDMKREIQCRIKEFASVTEVNSEMEVKTEIENGEAMTASDELKVTSREKRSHKLIKVKNFICGSCGKSFTKAGHLEFHRRKVHGVGGVKLKAEKKEKTFLCSTCSKAFYRQEQLDRHHKTHLPREKKYLCPHCPKKYDRRDKLKFHSRVHVVNKEELETNFLCIYCGHVFSNSSNLRVHLRRHTGEKPYKCDICQKGFPRSTDMLSHRTVHTGERPCVCKVCGKAFSHQHKLTRHLRVHTGDRPFKCTLCDRAFAQSNDLTLHIRRHTGDKPFACNVCGDRFYLNTVLQTHKRTHNHYDGQEQVNQETPRQQQSSVT